MFFTSSIPERAFRCQCKDLRFSFGGLIDGVLLRRSRQRAATIRTTLITCSLCVPVPDGLMRLLGAMQFQAASGRCAKARHGAGDIFRLMRDESWAYTFGTTVRRDIYRTRCFERDLSRVDTVCFRTVEGCANHDRNRAPKRFQTKSLDS